MALVVHTREQEHSNSNLWKRIATNKQTLRKEERKRKRIRNKERKIESIEWQACTNRLIPSFPLKPMLSVKGK